MLKTLDRACLSEMTLPNQRRADLMVLGPGAQAEIWIVEIKSCLADFQADGKWPEYRDFCDRLFFAVAPDFPHEVLPADTGVIIADRYGAQIMREPPAQRLSAARRKALILRFARQAAGRLQALRDPDAALEACRRRD